MKKRQTYQYPGARHGQSIFDFFQRDPVLVALQLTIILVMAVDFAIRTTDFSQNIGLFTFTMIVAMAMIIMPRLARLAGIRGFLIHALFHLMIGVFLVFIAPLGSAYELLAVLVMYTASYWYGSRGFVISFVFFLIVFQAAFLYQTETAFSPVVFSQLNVKLILLGLIGALIDRLHALDLKDRKQLLEMSEVVGYERERLRSLINSMDDAVIATNVHGRILVYNGAASELLGAETAINNKRLSTYMQTYTQKRHKIDLFAEVRRSGTSLKRDDILLRLSEHEYMNLYVSIVKVQFTYGEKGQEGFIFLLRDITKEKSVAEQHDEFISVISHELRTPITIAEANISTAMLPAILGKRDKLKNLLGQAHQNVISLADLVNDITTLTHAEKGDLEAKLEQVDLGQLVRDLVQSFQAQARAKKLKLSVSIPDSLPTIRSNAYRLNEILDNLLVNAIKYTEKGGVDVSITLPDTGHVSFSVRDTGIGMSKSDLTHIFHKFWRSEDYRTRAHSGTGLGLYISKKLAERMHGTLTAESHLNKGSVFTLTVPIAFD